MSNPERIIVALSGSSAPHYGVRLLEVLSAELTLSPNSTAGWGQLKEDSGLAMRFPRFTGRWRDDKGPQDATTTSELVDLYNLAQRAPVKS